MNGLEQLPTLQTLRAENNKIQTVQIPQTYTHLNKKASSLRQQSGDDNSSTNKSTTSLKKKVSTPSINNSSKEQSKDDSSAKQVALGMPSLSEVYLSGNMIKNLKGFNTLGTSMEVLDLSSNSLDKVDDTNIFISHLIPQTSLKTLKLQNNPLMSDEETIKKLLSQLKSSCSSIEMCDDVVLKKPPSQTEELKLMLSSPTKKLINLKDIAEPFQKAKDINEEDSDYESDVDNENFESVFQYNLKRRGPRLSLKDILSNEDIEYMETVFKELLEKSKMSLSSLLNTPFEALFKDATRNIMPLSLKAQLRIKHKAEKEEREALKPKKIVIDSPNKESSPLLVPITHQQDAERKQSMFTFENNFNLMTMAIDDLSIQSQKPLSSRSEHQIDDEDSVIGSTFIIDKVRSKKIEIDNSPTKNSRADDKAVNSIMHIKDELRLLRGSIDSVMRSAEKNKQYNHFDSRSITTTLSSPNFDDNVKLRNNKDVKELRRVKSEPKNVFDDDNDTINSSSSLQYQLDQNSFVSSYNNKYDDDEINSYQDSDLYSPRFNSSSSIGKEITGLGLIKPNPGAAVNVRNKENESDKYSTRKFKTPSSLRELLENDATLENYLRLK